MNIKEKKLKDLKKLLEDNSLSLSAITKLLKYPKSTIYQILMTNRDKFWVDDSKKIIKYSLINHKNVILRVNSKTYNDYRLYCKKYGMIISRQFELMMEKQMKNENF